jgi:hypothetical protein
MISRSAVLGGRADDRIDTEHERAGDQDRAQEVGPPAEADARVLFEQPQREHRRRNTDRDVDEKIQCQFIAWVKTPPASSPTEPPAETTKA